MTTAYRIGRLNIRLSGVSPETARAAMAALPSALAECLGRPRRATGPADAATMLARRLAADVARELGQRGRSGR